MYGPNVNNDLEILVYLYGYLKTVFYKEKSYDATRNSSKLAAYTTYKVLIRAWNIFEYILY